MGFNNPIKRSIKVVFPQPVLPIIPNFSPFLILKFMLSIAFLFVFILITYILKFNFFINLNGFLLTIKSS